MSIHESGEMYLESIIILREKNINIRAIDIVNFTGYSKPSISRAIGLLKSDSLISVNNESYITLTETGEAQAQKIYERHRILTGFLSGIGVPPDIATKDACRIEHVISDVSFDILKKYLTKDTENK